VYYYIYLYVYKLSYKDTFISNWNMFYTNKLFMIEGASHTKFKIIYLYNTLGVRACKCVHGSKNSAYLHQMTTERY